MASRIHREVYVRFWEGFGQTYGSNAARRLIPTLSFPKAPSAQRREEYRSARIPICSAAFAVPLWHAAGDGAFRFADGQNYASRAQGPDLPRPLSVRQSSRRPGSSATRARKHQAGCCAGYSARSFRSSTLPSPDLSYTVPATDSGKCRLYLEFYISTLSSSISLYCRADKRYAIPVKYRPSRNKTGCLGLHAVLRRTDTARPATHGVRRVGHSGGGA